jgi:hypothetical protein
MTTKCDYCRGSLGVNTHRYWRMRYCSVECVTAYQRHLDEGTVGKIAVLNLGLVIPESLPRPKVGSKRKLPDVIFNERGAF